MSHRWYAIEVSGTVAALRSLDRRFGAGERDAAALVDRCMRPAEIGPGLAVWAPRCEVVAVYKPRGQRHETTSTKLGPLCPGYVFARFAPALWSMIDGLPGIIGAIRQDGRLCPVSEASMARFLATVEAHRWLIRYDAAGKRMAPVADPRKRYSKGQTLRITAGPFAEQEGPYVDDASGEVILDLDIFGRTVQVNVPEALAVPA